LLGDKDVVPELIEMLKNARGLASQASISTALGLIGDQRSLEPLLAMLKGEGLTDTARAFAIVSLGNVCDPRPLPWNTPLALDVNYRALTSTLVGDSAGVLDIL
jgi:HEAT repeat protein